MKKVAGRLAGLGLPPQYYDILLGRKINQNVKKGTVVKWNLIGYKE